LIDNVLFTHEAYAPIYLPAAGIEEYLHKNGMDPELASRVDVVPNVDENDGGLALAGFLSFTRIGAIILHGTHWSPPDRSW